MAGSYRHIQKHEKEITELRVQSATLRQLGERSGFSVKQIKNFINIAIQLFKFTKSSRKSWDLWVL